MTNRPNNIMEGVGEVGEKREPDQIDLSSVKVFRYGDCRLSLASPRPHKLKE